MYRSRLASKTDQLEFICEPVMTLIKAMPGRMYSRYGTPSTSSMRAPSATPKTTRYRSEVRSGGIRVCTQTLVKRRISRERSVRKGLSAIITPDHLQVHLLDVGRPVALLQLAAGPLDGYRAAVYERDLLAQSLRLLQVVRRE